MSRCLHFPGQALASGLGLWQQERGGDLGVLLACRLAGEENVLCPFKPGPPPPPGPIPPQFNFIKTEHEYFY